MWGHFLKNTTRILSSKTVCEEHDVKIKMGPFQLWKKKRMKKGSQTH